MSGTSLEYIADFVALVFVVCDVLIITILGIAFIIDTIKFYLGSKNIKSIEFHANPFKLKITYFGEKK